MFLKIYFVFRYSISELCRPIGANFCTVVCTKPNFENWIQKCRCPPPPKKMGAKKYQILPNFGWIQISTASVSGTDENIHHWKNTFSITIPAVLGGKLVNFGPLITVVKLYPPNSTFLKDHTSMLGGCCTPKFLHVLENDQVLIAHPHRRWGSSLHFFKRGQNWLKIQRISAYNFGRKEIDLMKLCHMTCHTVAIITYVQLLGALPP